MTDLLTHVLAVYVLLTVASWWYPRIEDRYVAVAMVGTVLPDLSKLHLVVPPGAIETLFGVPFSWQPLHRLGGMLVVVLLGTLLFDPSERIPVGWYALVGALFHLPLDGLLIRADGLTPPFFYPFAWWRLPSGDLFLSSDLWPAIPIGVIAVLVWIRNELQKQEERPS